MKKPDFLKKGDTVAIVSTARKVMLSELDFAVNILKSWGLHIIFGETIGAESNQFAGDDALRTKDFQRMMNTPEIKAIWCARGGYGTVRIIEGLDFSTFLQNPKWIIGYSDVTVLHSHLHKLGVISLHAQMPVQLEEKTPEAAASIRKIIFGEVHTIEIEASCFRPADVKAPIVGGNLSILYSLCGSSSAVNTAGKILFIEDLDEYLYHIDRMLFNLKRNGMLSNLKGLLVGGMSDMHDNAVPFGRTAQQIIYDVVKEYNYPVCFGIPAGHIADNRAIILGESTHIQMTEEMISISFNQE